ncbi:MAG: hypothetical protein PHZ07_02100 [Patescibacteria group bacterium]|nr:hypothetical protein [Patescibacteria group bacterium]MDD4304024.1 hypothetical protein [Patescibacteria group bacterium]MDD4694901.1 hypothetical protein [Patescibacteria group bacterium]
MLSDEQITKYQMLYKNRFGKDISREEAYEQGIKLIRLIKLVYKPMTQEEYNQVQERRKEIYAPNNPNKS